MKRVFKNAISILVILAVSVGVCLFIYKGGEYPKGTNAYSFLYRGQYLLGQIKLGNLYPLYDAMNYNGIEFAQHISMLPIYVLAICIAFGKNIFRGYLLFLGLILFLQGLGFIIIGNIKNKLPLATVLGILYIFIPNNLYTVFTAGNLSVAFCYIFLPLLMFFVYEYFQNNKSNNLIWVYILIILIAMSDISYLTLTMAAIVLYSLVIAIKDKNLKGLVRVVLTSFLGVFTLGFSIVPNMINKGNSLYNVVLMKKYFQEYAISLNPVYRLEGNDQHVYFGLAIFTAAVFGIIACKRQGRINFVYAIGILLLSETTFYNLFSQAIDGYWIYILDYFTFAAIAVLIGLLYWDSIRRVFLVIVVILLAVDSLPSIMVHSSQGVYSAKEQYNSFTQETLLNEARDITTQRMILIDDGKLETVGQFAALVNEDGTYTKVTTGDNYQACVTSLDIVDINDSIERRNYLYMFTKLLYMGNDTVVIYSEATDYIANDISLINSSANELGYKLIDNNGLFYLYHKDTPENFGLKFTYSGIAIGRSAKLMCYAYPDLMDADSDYVDDYTYDQLKDYKLIYLSGFQYQDKSKAEKLIKKLADNGCHIVIDGSNLPSVKYKSNQNFLGVYGHGVTFENGYPSLYINDQEVLCDLFPREESTWKTYYLNGIEERTGYLYDNNEEITFMGHVYSDNITFLGLNIPYHYYLTQDSNSGAILNNLLGQYLNKIPKYELVELQVNYKRNTITIDSPEDNVNTSIAYLPSFRSNEAITNSNNILYVNKGQTTIKVIYKNLVIGIMISILAIGLFILFQRYLRKHEEYN